MVTWSGASVAYHCILNNVVAPQIQCQNGACSFGGPRSVKPQKSWCADLEWPDHVIQRNTAPCDFPSNSIRMYTKIDSCCVPALEPHIMFEQWRSGASSLVIADRVTLHTVLAPLIQ